MHAQNAAGTELVPVFTGVRVVLAWRLGQSESKRHIQSVTLDYGYLGNFEVFARQITTWVWGRVVALVRDVGMVTEASARTLARQAV